MPDTEELVYKEKSRHLYSLQPAGIIATIVNGLTITYLHLNLIPEQILLVWIITLLSLSLIRLGIYFAFRLKSEKIFNYHPWGGLFKIGMLLSGIIWGFASFFSYFHSFMPLKLLVAYVLGGMAAGNAGMYSAFRLNFYGFAIPATFPQLIIFILEGSPISVAMAGMLGFFIVLLSFSAEANRKAISGTYRLRFEKEALIRSLSAEKEITDKANQKLIEEVRLRTKFEDELRAARDELESRVIERTRDLEIANTQIKKSEETYRSIIETSLEGIWIISDAHTISYVNSRIALMLGYTQQEMIGQQIELFVLKTDIHKYKWTNGINEIRQSNLLRKDNTIVRVLESVSEIPIPVGNAGRFLCMVTDITELKKREEEIHRYAVSLEEKNNELDSFSHSVSHDLRNPLLTIKGFAQLLLEQYSDQMDNTGRDFLNRIVDTTKKMSTIIEDLLKLSRLSRLELSRRHTNLSDIADSILNDLKNADPERNVQIQIQSEIYADADPGLITIALNNLLGNAWKFTQKEKNGLIKFSSFYENTKQTFFVTDNGIGFDMKNAGNLFQPFRRLHSEKEFKGTGIGLVIVDRIIKKHSGKIWAHSKPGEGTTFYFTLEE